MEPTLTKDELKQLEAGNVADVEKFIHTHGAEVDALIKAKRARMQAAHEILDRKNSEELTRSRTGRPADHPKEQFISGGPLDS